MAELGLQTNPPGTEAWLLPALPEWDSSDKALNTVRCQEMASTFVATAIIPIIGINVIISISLCVSFYHAHMRN